ncbi:unnamed protein product, partial [Staurois parvus]
MPVIGISLLTNCHADSSATCQCPSVPALCSSMPPASAHQCRISARFQCPSVPHQCHISVPFSVTHQCCQSVPPISASQCRLSVCISAAYQCLSV